MGKSVGPFVTLGLCLGLVLGGSAQAARPLPSTGERCRLAAYAFARNWYAGKRLLYDLAWSVSQAPGRARAEDAVFAIQSRAPAGLAAALRCCDRMTTVAAIPAGLWCVKAAFDPRGRKER
jgi:hypothetical protein